jgi:hypothetical protein
MRSSRETAIVVLSIVLLAAATVCVCLNAADLYKMSDDAWKTLLNPSTNPEVPYTGTLTGEQWFADEMHKNATNVTSWQTMQISSNTVKLRAETDDSTWHTTYDLNVTRLPTQADATKFVNGMNQGYTISKNDNNLGVLSLAAKPSDVQTYVMFDTVTPPSIHLIEQLDNFVVYGTAVSNYHL